MRKLLYFSPLLMALAACVGTVTDNGSSSQSISSNSSVTSASSVPAGPRFRWERAFGINAGGDEFVSALGFLYQEDRDFVGGDLSSTVDEISNTSDDTLYQTERWGNYSYQLPVAAGRYRVILKMAEIYANANAARIFSVSVEGQQLVSNMDLHASFGHDVAFDVESPVIEVSDGNITIDVSATVDNGKLSAIEVFREEEVGAGENAGSVSIGKGLYAAQCESCHGDSGEGTGVFPALTLPACKTCTSYSELVAKIESTMPLGDALCTGSCAADTAAYILATFKEPKPIVPRIARLTHFQWKNAAQDLLYLDVPPDDQVDSFSPDAIVGYDTNTAQLRVTSTLRGDYRNAAEALAEQVAASTESINKLIPQGAPQESSARARAFIADFGLRAHRRPLTATEADQYFALFQKGPELLPQLSAFAAGVRLVVESVLQSPVFLYRTELGQEASGGRIPLTGYEIAAKLALAITGSGPDKLLLEAAASGALEAGNAGAVADQAERLLQTPGARATALHLHTQTYALSRYSIVQRNSNNYPQFNDGTAASLETSAKLFFQSIFDEDLGVSAILTSPTAYVDANLAPFYGLGGGFGSEFQKVDLSSQGRAGFLMQLGFLTLFSGEYQPDPIHRGVFINEHVLCVDVGRPAANIPPLPDIEPGQTNRERINAVTGPGTCGAACHATVINPLGFAFENFDPVGRYRSTDNGLPVDASDRYALDGFEAEFSDGSELVQQLGESDLAHHCYAEHWLSYLYGRLAVRSDDPLLDELAAKSKSENLSAKDVIRALVQSESFLTRESGE